jgi:D-alanyl-lipoteichoic acid acyltransferase DltB (MBOAT superfamily)
MPFNSIQFAIFLPIVFLLYWFGVKSLRTRNLFIVGVSCIFYGWWSTTFLLLIWLTIVCSYFSGLHIERLNKADNHRAARYLCLANIGINIGVLGIFKYFNFFGENIAALLQTMGIDIDWVTLDIVLPVGISFYTFQALSYSVDVYKAKIAASRDFIAFTAFLIFFPQLLAGPIERASSLLPQFQQQRRFDYCAAVDGMRQFLWGLFKKMAIADGCAPVVNAIFTNYNDLGSLNLTIGVVMVTFQIYCDFSGYSDMARGVARLFGINLMQNFQYPFLSRKVGEYWHRWHISLQTWLRDYIYFPLGGSRCGKWKTIRNTYVVFIFSGLWHGADWTFVIWGLYHATVLVPKIVRGRKLRQTPIIANDTRLPSLTEALACLWTFVLMAFPRIFFRSATVADSFGYIRRLFTCWDVPYVSLGGMKVMCLIAILMVCEYVGRHRLFPLQFSGNGLTAHRALRWSIYLILILVILITYQSSETFVYFQF